MVPVHHYSWGRSRHGPTELGPAPQGSREGNARTVTAMHEVDGDGVATLDLPEWPRLLRLSGQAERVAGIPGLASFLMAKAKQVSDAVPSVLHGGKLGFETFQAHRRDRAIAQYFGTNPWWPGSPAQEAEAMESRWALLGGWFGLPPAIALATADGAARRHDPAYVFVPPFAVAYATDLVVRLVGLGEPPTWHDVWERWRVLLPPIGYPPTRRNESLADSLARTRRRGTDPGIVDQPVSAASYPGFESVARQLKAGELRVV
jgi:hypothetical protein